MKFLAIILLFAQCHCTTVEVPVLEMERLRNNLDLALRYPGTAALVGHGLRLFEILAAARAVLEACENDKLNECIPLGGESGNPNVLESKSSFIMNGGSNNTIRWPRNTLKTHQKILLATYQRLCSLAHHIIQAMPLSWNQSNCCNIDANQTATLRLFRYFPHQAHPRYIGSAAHSDWGLLTLVLADDLLFANRHGGQLEISLQSQKWQRIAVPTDDSIILNAGDYLALSAPAGQVHSPRHRVLLDQEKDRISLVFFFYPDSQVLVPPALFSHGEITDGDQQQLSLLECQAASAECSAHDDLLHTNMTFSDFIKMKWAQVKR